MAENTGGDYVLVVNMTTFFNRELFMYSLGDIKFKKPIALKKVAYITLFFIIWTIPMFLIFGLNLNPYFFFFALVPPIVGGHFASKPVWGGMSLPAYLATLVGFIGEPKGWTDLSNNNKLEKEVLNVENEIWIGRRREYLMVALAREERHALRKQKR